MRQGRIHTCRQITGIKIKLDPLGSYTHSPAPTFNALIMITEICHGPYGTRVIALN